MKAVLFEYEDDLELLLTYLLDKEGFDVQVAATLEELRVHLFSSEIQLVVIGNLAENAVAHDTLSQIGSSLLSPHSLVLHLSTSHDLCEQLAAESPSWLHCVEVPLPPKALREILHRLRQELLSASAAEFRQPVVAR